MNIFATSPSPVISARALDTRRVNKMGSESLQMLCTAIRYCAPSETINEGDSVITSIVNAVTNQPLQPPRLWKSTHVNHPCNKWTRETQSNFAWLVTHALELCEVHYEYYGRRRTIIPVIELCCTKYMHFIPEGPLTPFADCTGIDDPSLDIHEKYRQMMIKKWTSAKTPPKFMYRPDWFKEN